MKRFKTAAWMLIGLFCANPFVRAEENIFPRVETPSRQFLIGEELVYDIRYLGFSIGEAKARIEETVILEGRKAYHLKVQVHSRGWVDWVYKVRNEHHSFMDVENLHSLQYEKNLNQGPKRRTEYVRFDQEKHLAVLRERGIEKKVEIPEKVQDAMSCGYYFRTLTVSPQGETIIPVHSEGKNWKLAVKLFNANEMILPGIGRFEALEAEPHMDFEGLFVKKGKIRGWISLDERRIPLKMKVKIPVLGSITAILKSYEPGKPDESVLQ